MHPRVAEEWSAVVSVYAGVRYLPGPDRILVDLDLDARAYNRSKVPLAVLVPPGYAATPPDGFLVPGELRFVDGSSLPASDAARIGMPGWLLVSFHLMDGAGLSTWHPTADPHRGDNLISYLSSVESFLDRGCN